MRKIYIWGTGKIATYICCAHMDKAELYNAEGFIDNNKDKEGGFFFEKPIFSPSILKQDEKYIIIILTASYKEIKQQVEKEYPDLDIKWNNYLLFTKYNLISRYEKEKDEEISKVIDYLRANDLQVFNYNFVSKYNSMDYFIEYDKETGLYFTLFENKKMYFARYLNSKSKVLNYYKTIILEQDMDSPHKYLVDGFDVDENSIIVDAGVAEGNFSLSVVENAKKIYLFEPNLDWIEALRYTFAPYKDKVFIVESYLSDFTNGNTITLDNFISENKVDFIKLDIEGEEYYALKGAQKTILNSERIKCAVCCYHQENDYVVLSNLLREFGMETKHSKGYMWFPYDKDPVFSHPTLRRGLIRAEKKG